MYVLHFVAECCCIVLLHCVAALCCTYLRLGPQPWQRSHLLYAFNVLCSLNAWECRHVYVCVCVCVCVWCVCACAYVCESQPVVGWNASMCHTCIECPCILDIYTYAHIYIYTHICMHIYVYTYIYIQKMHKYINIYGYVYLSSYMYTSNKNNIRHAHSTICNHVIWKMTHSVLEWFENIKTVYLRVFVGMDKI